MKIFTLGIVCCAACSAQKQLPNDQAVIQTAMLGFFQHEEWQDPGWRPKKQVVLRPEYADNSARPSFVSLASEVHTLLQRHVSYCERALAGKEKVNREELARIKGLIKGMHADLKWAKQMVSLRTKKTFVVPDPRPISEYRWDPRIVVSAKSNRSRIDETNRDTSLEQHAVYATTSLPAYSNDGRFAILKMSAPWSIHSADIYFLFERVGLDWKRRVVMPMFFV